MLVSVVSVDVKHHVYLLGLYSSQVRWRGWRLVAPLCLSVCLSTSLSACLSAGLSLLLSSLLPLSSLPPPSLLLSVCFSACLCFSVFLHLPLCFCVYLAPPPPPPPPSLSLSLSLSLSQLTRKWKRQPRHDKALTRSYDAQSYNKHTCFLLNCVLFFLPSPLSHFPPDQPTPACSPWRRVNTTRKAWVSAWCIAAAAAAAAAAAGTRAKWTSEPVTPCVTKSTSLCVLPTAKSTVSILDPWTYNYIGPWLDP